MGGNNLAGGEAAGRAALDAAGILARGGKGRRATPQNAFPVTVLAKVRQRMSKSMRSVCRSW